MDRIAFGRKLGASARVAGRMISTRVAAEPGTEAGVDSGSKAKAAGPPAGQVQGPPQAQSRPVEIGRKAATAVRGTQVGVKRFGEAFWGPFAHAGKVLWLEVTGLFFALFASWFVVESWKRRGDALRGTEHMHFVLYAVVAVVFLYFSFSSFRSAWRRGKRS